MIFDWEKNDLQMVDCPHALNLPEWHVYQKE